MGWGKKTGMDKRMASESKGAKRQRDARTVALKALGLEKERVPVMGMAPFASMKGKGSLGSMPVTLMCGKLFWCGVWGSRWGDGVKRGETGGRDRCVCCWNAYRIAHVMPKP